MYKGQTDRIESLQDRHEDGGVKVCRVTRKSPGGPHFVTTSTIPYSHQNSSPPPPLSRLCVFRTLRRTNHHSKMGTKPVGEVSSWLNTFYFRKPNRKEQMYSNIQKSLK